MMIEKGMQVDDIIFCDTGKEFPQMYEHIKKVEEYIKRPITILKADKSFDYYMFEHIKQRGKNKGKAGYGWAFPKVRWCTYLLKQTPVRKYLKELNEDYVQYIGIAYDEPKRHEIIKENEQHPLYDWHITEKEALEYCYSKGFNWGGLYEHFDRVSCFCCPFKSLKELKVLYKFYPELWQILAEMDKKSFNNIRRDYTIEQLEQKFKE